MVTKQNAFYYWNVHIWATLLSCAGAKITVRFIWLWQNIKHSKPPVPNIVSLLVRLVALWPPWVHFCEAHDFQLCVLWTGRRWSLFLLVPPLCFGRGMPDVCVTWSNKFWNVTVSSGPGMLWLCLLLSVGPTGSTGQLHCDTEQQDGVTAAGRCCLPSVDELHYTTAKKNQIFLSAFKGEKLLMLLNSIFSGLECMFTSVTRCGYEKYISQMWCQLVNLCRSLCFSSVALL